MNVFQLSACRARGVACIGPGAARPGPAEDNRGGGDSEVYRKAGFTPER